jgi:hypothetical protein
MLRTTVLQSLSVMSLLLVCNASAFTVGGPQQLSQLKQQQFRTVLQDSYSGGNFGGAGPSNGNVGNIEQIEFKIFPDGRVEETVRGIKGGSCHSVTDKINEQLGKVVDSSPTEEMYDQEVVIDQTLANTESWDGSTPSSW